MKRHTLKYGTPKLPYHIIVLLDMCGHLLGQMLDLKVKVKVKGQVDLLGHKVGHVDLKWALDLLGS